MVCRVDDEIEYVISNRPVYTTVNEGEDKGEKKKSVRLAYTFFFFSTQVEPSYWLG